MQDEIKRVLKTQVRGAYDLQKLRIQTGNRIAANFRAKLGQNPGEKMEDAEAKRILAQVKASHKLVASAIADLGKRVTENNFPGNEVISSLVEFNLIENYVALEAQEKEQFKRLGLTLKHFPIYTAWLQDVCGVGPAMAGVLLSEFDIHKAEYPSSLWRYAGLDVAEDGRGRSRRAEHLTDYEYTDTNGEVKTRKGITFNPFLKTKLMGVLASSFLRSKGSDGNVYARIYYGYKHRLENHQAHKDKTPGHRNNMALRYMIKRFLVDLYREWREIEDLPVAPEYSEAKLDMRHRKAA